MVVNLEQIANCRAYFAAGSAQTDAACVMEKLVQDVFVVPERDGKGGKDSLAGAAVVGGGASVSGSGDI